MSNELTYSDATKLAELIRAREVSPVEVMQAHLDRIHAVNLQVNAIVTIADGAMESAKAAEKAVLRGEVLGALHGVPFTAKDSIDSADLLTQRGSPIFKGRQPDQDATSIARLKNAGGILLAKTNLPEFSYWIESDNLLSGRSNNPWDLSRTPGGSSGGESAAVASGMSPLGLDLSCTENLDVELRKVAPDCVMPEPPFASALLTRMTVCWSDTRRKPPKATAMKISARTLSAITSAATLYDQI